MAPSDDKELVKSYVRTAPELDRGKSFAKHAAHALSWNAYAQAD